LVVTMPPGAALVPGEVVTTSRRAASYSERVTLPLGSVSETTSPRALYSYVVVRLSRPGPASSTIASRLPASS